MKTAVTQAIEKMQEAKDNFPVFGFDEEFIRGFNKAFQMAIFISEKVGKETEKQQIIEAHNAGIDNSDSYGGGTYYLETFKNE